MNMTSEIPQDGNNGSPWTGIGSTLAGGGMAIIGSVVSQVMANRAAQKERAWNEEQVRKQNAYNSFAAQKARLVASGISPSVAEAALLGNSSPSGGVATTSASPVPDYGSAISQGMLAGSQVANTNAQTNGFNIDNTYKSMKNDLDIELSQHQIKSIAANTDLAQCELEFKRQYNPKVLDKMSADSRVTYCQTQMLRLQLLSLGADENGEISQENLLAMKGIAKNQLDNALAQTGLDRKQIDDAIDHFEKDMEVLRASKSWQNKLAEVNYDLAKLSYDEQKLLTDAVPTLAKVFKHYGTFGGLSYLLAKDGEVSIDSIRSLFQSLEESGNDFGESLGEAFIPDILKSKKQLVHQELRGNKTGIHSDLQKLYNDYQSKAKQYARSYDDWLKWIYDNL